MEPEQLRDCPTPLSNYVTVDSSPECPQQQPCSSSSSLVQDLMDTIMEFEEEEVSCSTPDSKSLKLASPLACNEMQSPEVSFFLQTPESPLHTSYPLPPTNTPSTGHGVHSHHLHLAGIQAATKLAMATHHSYHQGLQVLRDSLAGLFHEEQLQGDGDVLSAAAAFIQFCRRQAGKDLGKMFKAEKVI